LILGQPEIYVDHITGIFPDQSDDVATAVRLARNPPTTSAIYGLVNGLVGAIGGSAGGTHATWVATHGSITDDKVNVAVSLSGAYDAADFDDAWNPAFKNNWLSYLNVTETDVAALNAASPAFADLTDASPLFLIASVGDSMPPRQLPTMVAALDAAGVTNYQQLIISGNLHSLNYWDQVDVDGLTVGEKAIAFLAAGFSQATGAGK
jgi:dipeptidyl aminopeptidase/acylaminoacyl peptidase